MALEKVVTEDKIEVLGSGHIQVRTKTAIVEDGVELSSGYHRHVIAPGDDYSSESAKVQAICAAVHTAEVIAAYQASQPQKENNMTTFTTTITALYTLQQPEPDYVVTAMWEVTGVDGVNTASIGGSTQFSSSEASGDFVPFDQLTETEVIGWIPESEISSAQSCVQGQIDSMITPPVSPENTPLPW